MTEYQNRYQRAAVVIRRSLIRNGKLPTEARLVKAADVTEPTARYMLSAWNAFHADSILSIPNPNRYHRAAWAIRRSLKRNGKLPTVSAVAKQCAMSENIAHACLRAWDAFQVA